MIDYFINKCRSFIYSTALPPSVIGANIGAIRVIKSEPHRIESLLKNSEYFRSLLKEREILVKGSSQIVPVIIDYNEKAVKISNKLLENNIYALPVRPPTVEKTRIRFSLTFHHSKEILEKVVNVLTWAMKQ